MNDHAALGFFLASGAGQRFCMYHPPAPGPCRGAVLFVAPFGDEMNKSRRMAALQARRLAAQGFGVLLPDLGGCGDSDGEMDWAGWHADLAQAAAWLGERLEGPLYLLGLRLGGLLALDFARRCPAVAGIVLWQPVTLGEAFITQLLRLKLAGNLLAEGGAPATGSAELRAALDAGEVLEIGGYELTPAMARDIGVLEAAALAPPGCPVHWFELVADASRPLSPATVRIAAAWRGAGVALATATLACPPFWSTQEIHQCDALLAATGTAFDGMHA